MKKKNYFLKWAVVLIVLSLLPATVVINAEEEPLTYEEHIAILDTLPYFLEGTILDGNTRVVVTEDGNPPINLDPSLYDMAISFEDRDLIFEQAKNEFIENYGVYPADIPPDPVPLEVVPPDAFPCPFEIHLFDGTIISSDDFMNMIHGGIIIDHQAGGPIWFEGSSVPLYESDHISDEGIIIEHEEHQGGGPIWNEGSLFLPNESPYISPFAIDPHVLDIETLLYYLENGLAEIVPLDPDCGSDYSCVVDPEPTGGPHAIYDQMHLNLFIPMDSEHIPDDCPGAVDSAIEGWSKFGDFGNPYLGLHYHEYWGVWDASDVGDSSEELLDDLKQDCSAYRLDDSYLMLGFVHFADHNGMADRNGFYSIVAERAPVMQFKDHLIVTHELSHNIGGMDDTWFGHGRCYMEYFWLWAFSRFEWFMDPDWCDSCYDTMFDNIWQL